jgi:N-acetylglucosamine kinase-like BadF-type ATPase
VTHYFLGVDGGGSHTTALIGDETGLIVAEGHGGPSAAGGQNQAVEAADAQWEAKRTSEAAPDRYCCYGTAGRAEKDRGISKFHVGSYTRTLKMTHDADIALSGALAGEPGIIVIAGTGSMAFGRDAKGDTARAGGWGYVFGDEGGAFDIVRQAVRAALRFEEGWGAETALRSAFLDAPELHWPEARHHGHNPAPAEPRDMNRLLHLFYTGDYPRDRVAALAPIVEQTAEAGDAIAREILHNAAQALAMFAIAVRKQLFQDGEACRVSYAGGVFQNPIIRQRFSMLVELDTGRAPEAPRFTPAEGALIEAYRLAGLNVLPRRA